VAVGVLALVAVGAGAGWAVTTVLTPAEDVLESTPYTYVSVEPGEVGASIQLNTVAEWTPVPVGANRAVGVVTGVTVAAGDEVSQGSTLYTVDLKPVVVAQGDVPSFRAIGQDTEGADVAQLQTMLAARGFYSGTVDGKAKAGTVRAIKAWQKSLGVPQTGAVDAGDVIYVPTLPTRVALDEELIFRGATLAGGEEAVQGLPAAPVFEVPVTTAQAAMMPAGTRVQITAPEGAEWAGFVVEQKPEADTGNVIVSLAGESGAVICADQCGQVPVSGESILRSRIVTQETVAGLVVPSAALVTGADGQVAVIDQTGERVPVTVVAAAKGMSVVEGVSDGTRVRIPGEGT
jgi:peptidoglycan hydrolase-like protein with peptidoglycan-binding domain